MKTAKQWAITLATPSGAVGSESAKRLVFGIRAEVVEALAKDAAAKYDPEVVDWLNDWWRTQQGEVADDSDNIHRA